MALPKHNIFWRDITPAMCVVERPKWFEVKMGRKRAIAYWGSRDARAAQTFLKQRAAKGCNR